MVAHPTAMHGVRIKSRHSDREGCGRQDESRLLRRTGRDGGTDWLEGRQDAIEAGVARRHLAPAANPARMALFDLSSSWLEGRCCPLGARGWSRDGKKGTIQIEYGLLTDPAGRPVAVRVFEGNTADPAAFTEILGVVHDTFRLAKMVMAGDRGMITSARIEAVRELDGKYGWI